MKTKANFDDVNGDQTTDYTAAVDSSNSSASGSKILSPNSTTPFGLSSLDISITASGSGEINFHPEAIVHMPEPSTVAMSLIGIPLLTLGLVRKFKRMAKAPAVG